MLIAATFTFTEKIKHKRKKVKMAVLKYYRVDSDGKIKRLRRECPTAECGAGVFMAAHADRQYCGKCECLLPQFTQAMLMLVALSGGLTYMFNDAAKA